MGRLAPELAEEGAPSEASEWDLWERNEKEKRSWKPLLDQAVLLSFLCGFFGNYALSFSGQARAKGIARATASRNDCGSGKRTCEYRHDLERSHDRTEQNKKHAWPEHVTVLPITYVSMYVE